MLEKIEGTIEQTTLSHTTHNEHNQTKKTNKTQKAKVMGEYGPNHTIGEILAMIK